MLDQPLRGRRRGPPVGLRGGQLLLGGYPVPGTPQVLELDAFEEA
ncbi:hypothetical protein WDV06_15060 [Streptomyces racemochromogenes]|uniref:Uncharacterized protein n=1 Tax=Streptomyces racemochromogenes TaxID=67353 RepID=A0ABW7PDG2_9ACTN